MSMKSETHNIKTVCCRIRTIMTTNKSVEHLNAPQETATNCGYVGWLAICFANITMDTRNKIILIAGMSCVTVNSVEQIGDFCNPNLVQNFD